MSSGITDIQVDILQDQRIKLEKNPNQQLRLGYGKTLKKCTGKNFKARKAGFLRVNRN